MGAVPVRRHQDRLAVFCIDDQVPVVGVGKVGLVGRPRFVLGPEVRRYLGWYAVVDEETQPQPACSASDRAALMSDRPRPG